MTTKVTPRTTSGMLTEMAVFSRSPSASGTAIGETIEDARTTASVSGLPLLNTSTYTKVAMVMGMSHLSITL